MTQANRQFSMVYGGTTGFFFTAADVLAAAAVAFEGFADVSAVELPDAVELEALPLTVLFVAA